MIDYKLGISIGSLAVVLIILGLNAQSLTTQSDVIIPITPNLGEKCPNDKYLEGYDLDGSVMCQSYPFSLANVTSREITHSLQGLRTAEPFYTSSPSWVDTGFPTNPYFTKRYDNSQLWLHLFIDFSNDEDGKTDFISLGIANLDGNVIGSWNMHDGPAIANNLLAHDMMRIYSGPAGDYKVVVRVAVNGGEGLFKTNIAAINIWEIPISKRLPFDTTLLEEIKKPDITDTTLPNIESTLNPGCGDGVRDRGEQCDDGNNLMGDGCSEACRIEFCGDGILQPTFEMETCDDGNNINKDGCDSGCKIETECFYLTEGDPCGDQTDNDCDNPDTCDFIYKKCRTNLEPAGTACGVSPDSCDGSGVCIDK